LKEKTMASRQIYEELKQRVIELESEIIRYKQIEHKLYENQELYRLHFTLANDVMYSLDPEYRVLSVSPSVETILGYKPEELIGRPFHELNVLDEEYLEQAFSNCQTVFSGIPVSRSIYRFITKDGKHKYASVSGVPLKRDGRAVAIISVARDITDHMEMERSLRESEERFRAIFDSAQDCIFIKDMNLNYTFVNPYMEQLFCLKSTHIIGKKFMDIFGEFTSRDTKEIDMCVLNGEIIKDELILTVGGGEITFHIIKVPIRNISGEVAGLCGIARNITERKHFEETLREKEKDLESQAKNLEEVNTALKVLIDYREEEKKKAQEDIVAKAKKLIFPYLEKLERGNLTGDGKIYLDIIRANLNELISSYVTENKRQYLQLTPTEIQVADLIKQGKTTKEMASVLNVSLHAVSFHRANIRKKLNLQHKKTNLRAYLQSTD
jgi:PAS domain S-box-containing protein